VKHILLTSLLLIAASLLTLSQPNGQGSAGSGAERQELLKLTDDITAAKTKLDAAALDRSLGRDGLGLDGHECCLKMTGFRSAGFCFPRRSLSQRKSNIGPTRRRAAFTAAGRNHDELSPIHLIGGRRCISGKG
jgi:hypothetical protein